MSVRLAVSGRLRDLREAIAQLPVDRDQISYKLVSHLQSALGSVPADDPPFVGTRSFDAVQLQRMGLWIAQALEFAESARNDADYLSSKIAEFQVCLRNLEAARQRTIEEM